MATQRIIVGIDFGTTYSGVAWAHSSSPQTVTPIRQWPDATGKQDVDKVPSEMTYLPDGTFKWGFQATLDSVRKNGSVLQYMKLLLDPSQEQGSSLSDPLGLNHIRARLPANKQPVDVVADYLRALKAHALDVLSKNFGTEFWNVIPVEYHLTIPAVWSDAAKALTHQAANQAGIGSAKDLILIAEPEAAALYCLTDLYQGLLKTGDTFVVVDCGGGTVDLVSYKVLAMEPAFEVKEVAVGGGLCGSVFLNRRFESFVRKRLGANVLDNMIRKERPYFKMMKEFDERLKRVFKDCEDNETMDCEVPGLPDDSDKGVEDGFLEISRQEMKGIFDPVIKEVLRLVQVQIDSVKMAGHPSISLLLLVGGFGSSPYLYQRVQEHIAQQAGSLKILQPANAWSAVARGAVICGLQTIVIRSRKARRNYGVRCRFTFDPSIHPEKDRVWDHVMKEYFCTNRVSWYVRKDDEVEETQKISFPFSRSFGMNQTDFSAKSTLVASNSSREEAENDARHPNVLEVCHINNDLSALRKHFKLCTNSLGGRYYRVEYDLVMHIHSAQLTFVLECEGEKYGNSSTATFV